MRALCCARGTQPSEDLEPEYIAVAGDRAFVSLQETTPWRCWI